MKIVYFGTDVFLSCFLYLVEHHEVLALYTYHNDEDYFTEYSIVGEAKKRGIPVHYEDMTEEKVIRLFAEEGCGLFVSAEYNRLIPVPPMLSDFRGINMHSSLLPEGRSYYPIECAMHRGLTRTGITVHKMTAALDGGDILGQVPVEITGEMDSMDVYLACADGAEKILRGLMEDMEGSWNRALRQKQTEKKPYWKRPDETAMTLTHQLTRAQALACFRRYNQMTQVEAAGRWYYVRAMNTGTAPLHQEMVAIEEDRVLYQVADGHLRLILQEKSVPGGQESAGGTV